MMCVIRAWVSWQLLRLANGLLTIAIAIDPALQRTPQERCRDAGLLPRR